MSRTVFPLAVVALAALTSGCELCLLPCYVCLPVGNLTADDDRTLPEVQPALLAAEAARAEAAQLPAR